MFTRCMMTYPTGTSFICCLLATVFRLITEVGAESVNFPTAQSPCPSVFDYESPGSENDRWYGILKLRTDYDLYGIWIDIILDKKADLVGNWFGDVTTKDNKEFKIENTKEILHQDSERTVRFFVKFGLSIPRLTSLRLNGREICKAASNNQPDDTSVPRRNTQTADRKDPPREDDYFSGDFNPSSNTKPNPNLPRRELAKVECGKIAPTSVHLITYGTRTNIAQHPWHVAIYRMKGVDSTYICGGSLVSLEHVITAAHCVTRGSNKAPINKNILTLHFGKHNLRTSVEGVQISFVTEINVHPEYATFTTGNDIAILTLKKSVDYTQYVRPVCLWPDNLEDVSYVVGKTGTVVGWGFDEDGHVTEDLRLSQMPIVDELTCIRSFEEFFVKFTSNTTYCAGYMNGTSVCNGDSGGGMVFPLGGKSNLVWYLRGLVSLSAALQNQARCDPSHYIVFTDLAKFSTWIQSILQSSRSS